MSLYLDNIDVVTQRRSTAALASIKRPLRKVGMIREGASREWSGLLVPADDHAFEAGNTLYAGTEVYYPICGAVRVTPQEIYPILITISFLTADAGALVYWISQNRTLGSALYSTPVGVDGSGHPKLARGAFSYLPTKAELNQAQFIAPYVLTTSLTANRYKQVEVQVG